MRRFLLGLMLLLLAVGAMAQAPGPINPPPSLLNFQGRLAKPDGTPVPDASNYALTLSLWDTATVGTGVMRWQQTFSNVTVHNGVFALILNLTTGFTGTNTLDSTLNNSTYLQIQVGANPPIAPRQQIVSAAYALKAGSVPDGSITAAKLAADARSVTGAAGGDLTGAYPTPQIKTDSSLLNKVSGTLLSVAQATTVTDISQTNVTATVTSTAWQSFTPGTTGTLVEIDVYCGTSGASIPATLSLYAGQGTSSNPLQTIPVTVNPALGLQSFPITASVTAGQVYTWAIGSNNNLLFGYAGGNPYSGGLTDLGTTFDYGFKTLMKSVGGPTTQINTAANIFLTGTNTILENAAIGPMVVKQFNPFTSGTYNGIGRYGMFVDPATLFLAVPNDVSGGSVRLGSWTPSGTRNDVLTVLNTGQVGVGNTSPDQALTVGGNAHITGAGNGLIFPDGSKQTTAPVFQGAAAGGDLTGSYPNPSLATLATSLNKVSGGVMTSAGGNIGIGATAPTEKTQIGDFSASDTYLAIKSAGGNRFRTGLKLRSFADDIGFNIENDERVAINGLNILRFPGGVPNGVSAMFIDKFSGAVGLGTLSPIATLDVNGGAAIRGGNTLEFGAGVSGKEPQAGKIGYGTFDAGVLDIVGGGTNGSNRQVKIYAEGGTTLTGGLSVAGGVSSSGLSVNGNGSYISAGDANALSLYNTSANAVTLYAQGNDTNAIKAQNNSSFPTLYTQNLGSGEAAHFNGRMYASSKNFIIDHPLDPENKYLIHGCVESDEMRNIYDGTVTLDAKGEATVQMAHWFQALNKEYRYQLTCIGGYAQVYVAEEMTGNHFKIAGGSPGLKVSWQVTGVRQDAWAKANPMTVEKDKGADRGKYLQPTAFGLPVSRGGAMTPAQPAPKKADPKAKAAQPAKITQAQPNAALETENAELKKQLAALAEAVRKLQEKDANAQK